MAVTSLNGESGQTAHTADGSSANGSTPPLVKGTKSLPDHNRRHSLPPRVFQQSIWSNNSSGASLVETEEAARGEHILDESSVAHRISALRQLNGATHARHQYAKSTGARSTTYNQPVIVRTYSGSRPQSRQRELPPQKRFPNMGKAELPPVEAFSFKGIMDSIHTSVADDLERIAEICARSRYSLSNQYEVHMPPHGEGEAYLQTPVHTVHASGPTLQAIGSEDEQPRPMGRRSGRRTKSRAYGTLETIMSSSRSSEEEKSKKKSAGKIAEEVRGRAARKASAAVEAQRDGNDADEEGIAAQRPPPPLRPRSSTFASLIVDSAQNNKGESSQNQNTTSLVSEPARPQTSITTDEGLTAFDDAPIPSSSSKLASLNPLTRLDSPTSTLLPESEQKASILGNFSSWLPWNRGTETAGENISDSEYTHRPSHAEGSLRELLKASEGDRKGKKIDRPT